MRTTEDILIELTTATLQDQLKWKRFGTGDSRDLPGDDEITFMAAVPQGKVVVSTKSVRFYDSELQLAGETPCKGYTRLWTLLDTIRNQMLTSPKVEAIMDSIGGPF